MNNEIKIVGACSPPLTDNMEELVSIAVQEIERTGPNVVWIGLGAPKQMFIASEIKKRLSGKSLMIITVGAAFDFYAGEKKIASKAVSNLGLEWIFRILQEPSRLLPRYAKVARAIPFIIVRLLLGRGN